MPDTEIYTVTIYATVMTIPFSFAYHTWVEIEHAGQTNRYDLWAYPGMKSATKNKKHVYLNIFPNHLGTTLSPFASVNDMHKRQTGKVLSSVSGKTGSSVHKLYATIKEHAFTYPAADKYNMLLGPNCNTYTQWLIDLRPEANLRLPWRAWGKGRRIK